MQTKIYQQPNSEKAKKDKTDDRNETSSESDDFKEKKKSEEKSNLNTATVRINGIEKENIIDTGSPITIMPPKEKILKSTGIEQITN